MQRLAAANPRASPAAVPAATAARRGSPSTSSRAAAAAAPALLPSRPAFLRRHRRSAVKIAASASSALDAVADAIDEATGEKTREIKAQLLDSLFGTERGLSASSEVRKKGKESRKGEIEKERDGQNQKTLNDVSPLRLAELKKNSPPASCLPLSLSLSMKPKVRAEINELITALEARNSAAPLDSADDDEGSKNALLGVWKLAYTSSSELVPLLALGKLPFVTVGDVTQTIATDNLTGITSAVNAVALSVPLSKTTVSTTAAVDVVSAKRVAVRFERGRVATPQLLAGDDLASALRDEVPETVTVAGQAVDLSGIKNALLVPAAEAAGGLARRLAGALRRAPDLDFALPRSEKATTWLINTYIDEDTRIARGDGGSVFVMVKEEEEELAQRASTVEEIDAVEERRQAAGAVKEVEAEALIDE